MKRILTLTTIGLAALFALALLPPQTGQALIGSSPLQPVGLFCLPKQPGADLAFARAQCDNLVSKGADAELIGGSPLAFLKPCNEKTDGEFFLSGPGICQDLRGAVYDGDDKVIIIEGELEFPATRSPKCAEGAEAEPPVPVENFKLWLCMSADDGS